jgi:glucose/arabinose dehydrogenase
MTDPAVVWTPAIAPSGLTIYTGDRFPDWKGDLFAGGLVTSEVRRIDLDGDRVVGETTMRFDARVRDVRTGPDGYLYVLTDEPQGRLLRILPQ